MENTNIWQNLDLSDDQLKTSFDYLLPQVENFRIATKEILQMNIEITHSVTADNPPRNVTLYSVYIIAPLLGNYRKKIFHVGEYSEIGRFPVQIYSDISGENKKNVTESEFLEEVQKILDNDIIKNTIENLYRQSKQNLTG